MRYLRKCGANGIVGRHRCDPKLFCRHAAHLAVSYNFDKRVSHHGVCLWLILLSRNSYSMAIASRSCTVAWSVIALARRPTSRDLFGQIAALAHLAWHGVILVTRFYTMCLFSCHSACRFFIENVGSIIRLRMCNHPSGL
jgi:hypothetical protein